MASREEEKAFMQNVDAWPHWPVQTVKKRRTDGGFPDVGLLSDSGSLSQSKVEPIVHLVNLYEATAELLMEGPREVFADWDALLDAGWVID